MIETNVMEMPTFKVAPVKHDHAAHKVPSHTNGKTWCIDDCPDCQAIHAQKVARGIICCPKARGVYGPVIAERPQCPACQGENK